MKCPICNGSRFRPAKGPYRFTESGLDWVYLLGVRHGRCDDCKDHVVVLPEPEMLFAEIAKRIMQNSGPLRPAEIRFLRRLVGWSQDNLAVAMGVERVTVARWEGGTEPRFPHMHILLKAVWLRRYLEESRERGCGILKHEDLTRLSDQITRLGEAIRKIRSAVPGRGRITIDVRTLKAGRAAR
jgi:DNA-binding transcriptional regulator YiaG